MADKKREVAESRKEALRRLFLANNLHEEDIHKDQTRGFVTIKRTGIEKIAFYNNITLVYEMVNLNNDGCVIKCKATMVSSDGVIKNTETYGESSSNNCSTFAFKFPVAMAEKRAKSRAVLQLTGFYEQGVYGQDELAD
jgi:hypothetical protein